MSLDPIAIFMLGVMVGQWQGVFMLVLAIRAVVRRTNNPSSDTIKEADRESLIARLIGREPAGTVKPRTSGTRQPAPPHKKKQ